jgi:hypothetical protein
MSKNAHLLRGDEGLEHDADGHVHVIVRHVLAQVHARVGMGGV